MNSKIIHILEYPCALIHDDIMLAGCEHSGKYNDNEYHCEYCPDSKSCTWINIVNVSDSQTYTNKEFTEHLEYALDRMIAYVSVLEHNIFTCPCNTCSWIQEAMLALEKFSTRQ